MSAWIGLGGNFAESECLIKTALAALDEHDGISVLRASGIYRSAPWGVTDQADFVNAVAELQTSLAPLRLLSLLQGHELRLGRDRQGDRWGPRCIDLDLLTYDNLMLNSEQLDLPHPRMHLRAFVLLPILELEPGFDIPGIGKAKQALDRLERSEVGSVRLLAQPKQEAKK